MDPILLYHAFKATTPFVDSLVNERLRQLLPTCQVLTTACLRRRLECMVQQHSFLERMPSSTSTKDWYSTISDQTLWPSAMCHKVFPVVVSGQKKLLNYSSKYTVTIFIRSTVHSVTEKLKRCSNTMLDRETPWHCPDFRIQYMTRKRFLSILRGAHVPNALILPCGGPCFTTVHEDWNCVGLIQMYLVIQLDAHRIDSLFQQIHTSPRNACPPQDLTSAATKGARSCFPSRKIDHFNLSICHLDC